MATVVPACENCQLTFKADESLDQHRNLGNDNVKVAEMAQLEQNLREQGRLIDEKKKEDTYNHSYRFLFLIFAQWRKKKNLQTQYICSLEWYCIETLRYSHEVRRFYVFNDIVICVCFFDYLF